ncbi:MAG: NAD(P)/FAD-dependent oxidoreductase [Rhizonema sp. PD37]|nr:NAD(P)/FAD-dependent oxidoreductase [Rhizonema sp. PD37]
MLTKESSTAKETKHSYQNVLIVGGGPAGLATALMLAKRGWTNITLLEKRAAADYYEPDKSYNYLIDGRGQKLTDFLGLTHKLSEISVPSTQFILTRIKPNGSRKTSKSPVVDRNRKTAYWLPRRAFVLLLYQEIERNWQEQINVLFNTSCFQINKTAINDGEEKLEIIAYEENGNIMKFEPSLLVGCDGINSIVRNTIKEWDKSTSNGFEMKYFPSPSSNLKYKVLSLPPNFPLDSTGKEHSVCDTAYAIRGTFTERLRSVSLGLLPQKNPNEPRRANIIRHPDHKIWELKNSEEVYKFFEQAFPQLPISQIVSSEEAERFAESEGGYFPIPQYSSKFHFLLKRKQVGETDQSTNGVVLLGDAIHCFPPDIGQGVNSALEDVFVLNEALSETNDDLSLALPLYESLRFPDVKALIRLAETAYPWQYNQAPLRTKLWSINFFLRLLLSRLLPFIFSPPAFFLIQNHQLSYQEILVMVQRTTQIFYVFAGVLICGFLAFVLRTVEI